MMTPFRALLALTRTALSRPPHRTSPDRSPRGPARAGTADRPRPRRSRTLAALVAAGALLVGTGGAAQADPVDPPRVIAFYQTIYETDADGVRHYVDPLPLTGAVTDVNVGAIHLNDDLSLHVNDIPADHAELVRMWDDLRTIQAAGVTVSAFVGGAAAGSYRNLADDFDTYYPILRDFLVTYGLDGVDLDIEETFSLADAVHLVRTLRADLGPDFVITLTPVATDLAGTTAFSGGFDYAALEAAVGDEIDWYNAQFYCGWGDLRTTSTFDAVVANGFAPGRVVAGTVANPGNCGGWVEPATLDATLTSLVETYPTFGGVFGWEYFNALGPDGGTRETWFSHLRDVLAAAAVVEPVVPEEPVVPVPDAPAAVAVQSGAVVAGQEQVLTGSGFVPGEQVRVTMASTPTDLGTVVADADGGIRLAFVVPAQTEAGMHTLTATGATTTASITFTVTAAPTAATDPATGTATGEVAAATGTATTTRTAASAATAATRLATTGGAVLPGLGAAGALVLAGGLAVVVAAGARRARADDAGTPGSAA